MARSTPRTGEIGPHAARPAGRSSQAPTCALLCTAVTVLLVMACAEGERSYLDRRADFSTKLISADTTPVLRGEPPPLKDWGAEWGRWENTWYPSGDWELRAYVFAPKDRLQDRRPAFVWLHGGAFLDSYITLETLEDTRPIVDAGFVVMVPMFGGEEGNPGRFEYAVREVEEAADAVRWLVEQPYVDPDHTYAMGYSYGGNVATLLSLLPDVPVRHSASYAGMATHGLFDLFQQYDANPFDDSDPVEREMRMLLGNIKWMQHRHYAYLGGADERTVGAAEAARREVGDAPSLLEIVILPGGDHTRPSAQRAIEMHLRKVLEEIDERS